MKSATHANAVLNTARGTAMAAWSPWLALYTSDPLTGGAEVLPGSGYGRQPVTFGPPLSGFMTNTAEVAFAQPTALWGEVTHAALMDAQSGGSVRVSYLLGGTAADRTLDATSRPARFGPGTINYRER